MDMSADAFHLQHLNESFIHDLRGNGCESQPRYPRLFKKSPHQNHNVEAFLEVRTILADVYTRQDYFMVITRKFFAMIDDVVGMHASWAAPCKRNHAICASAVASILNL